jgi:FkbH-like protein
MKFLEAHQIVRGFQGGESLPFLLAMSGTADPLLLYVRAAAAQGGRDARVETLPFNTLGQALMSPAGAAREVFLLAPWDFVPALDWRSGVSAELTFAQCRDEAQAVAGRLRARPNARVVYVPAPVPPSLLTPAEDAALLTWIESLARSLDATVLAPEAFQLGGYFASGCPVASAALGGAAAAIVAAALHATPSRKKIVVTDLDDTMWSGIIGEDGPQGIKYLSEGKGFRHFVYQTYLKKLQKEGVILAAVSRNDQELAIGPFREGKMVLTETDFVCVVASYMAKSAQIKRIAEQLNLGLDSFVFVDDNPVEIAEVGEHLPQVTCIKFPKTDDELPALLGRLAPLFAAAGVTEEDKARTEMYRRRMEGMVPSDAEGADLSDFLKKLEMTVTVHDRSTGDRTRAVQLINKTNQFNLNGRRVTDEEVGSLLAAGGRLFTATLDDRTGSHGEVFVCLMGPDRTVESLVMSCRVFQRRVEYAVFAWLCERPETTPTMLRFEATPRNEPVQQFLAKAGFADEGEGLYRLDAEQFRAEHGSALEILTLVAPAEVAA